MEKLMAALGFYALVSNKMVPQMIMGLGTLAGIKASLLVFEWIEDKLFN